MMFLGVLRSESDGDDDDVALYIQFGGRSWARDVKCLEARVKYQGI
jgi:hypothetical protein